MIPGVDSHGLYWIRGYIRVCGSLCIFIIIMSNRVKRNLNTLKVLNSSSSELRKAVLSQGDRELILAVCEVLLNVLTGNIKLTPT